MEKNSLIKYLIILAILIILVIVYSTLNTKKDVSFTINKEIINVIVGGETKIDYSISDKNINITWKSNDTSIATVNNIGEVYGINTGNTIITGEINVSGNNKTIYCFVNVITPNYDIELKDITLPEGEILMSTGEEYFLPITYIPSSAYIEKIKYNIEDTSIAKIDSNKIVALKPGYTKLTVIANNSISKDIMINVTDEDVTSRIIQSIDDLTIEEIGSIDVNEEKNIQYIIDPPDATVFDILWESSNPSVATVSTSGLVKGLKNGTTTITLTINNHISEEIKLTVKNATESIVFDYSIKQVLKVGDTYNLYPTILPKSSSNKNVTYESNNPNVLTVLNNGTLIARSTGNAIITIKSTDNNVSKNITFTVVPMKGVLNSTQYIWAFNKETDKIPQRADINFFRNLAAKGIGIINNNNYIYQQYTYNIKNSILTINGSRNISVRFYYPPSTDLSALNTFTYIGGSGEVNFSGLAKDIDDRPSLIKISGILIMIVESNFQVTKENVVEATNFVKLIINQNQRARNIIGGYSNGGPISGEAANIGNYDKFMLINTSFYWVNSKTNLTNKEFVVYTANEDSWNGTSTFISELYTAGIKNVTIISNNPSMSSAFGNRYLVINPGNAMEKGHTSNNLLKSHYFSYAFD